ncbi:sensor domain-containing protein [Caproicibacter fermentans]|uniref:Diguanylate cyclase n=1 Tax=Caproicibacter fermentans TaxID=2576756 RepID=A0A7G8T6G4_9FIRM|nr:diguanylate cyclase [Caproicibacter fermentans]QNK39205.1 diguanylate cyclase [Caproicibacter fermentans]
MGSLNLEQLIDDLGCSLLCCKPDSRLSILYASKAFFRTLGYAKDEISALLEEGPEPVLRNNPPVDWERIREEIRAKGFANPELRLIKKDGHHIWASYRVRLQKDQDGAEFFSGVLEDITLRRRSRRQRLEQAQELEALTANVPCGVLRCRSDEFLTLNFVSEGFCRMTGYRRDEIAAEFGSRFIQMIYEKDRDLLLRQAGGRMRRDGAAELTYRIMGKSGRLIWVLDKSRVQEDCNGNVWLYSVLMDITETQKAQEELAATEERYRMILEHAADPVVDFDLKTSRIYYSPAFTARFGTGFPQYGNLMADLPELSLIYEPDRRRLTEKADRLLHGEVLEDDEFRFLGADGVYIWCNVHPAAFLDEQGKAARLIVVISDIDRRKKESIALRQRAEHDLLTGLYNRVTAVGKIEKVIARSEREERHALFVIDIDNFKNVNDRLGHLKGDELIVETAARIKRLFREEDIVGRIGGDEFVVFLRGITSVNLVVKKAECIGNAFRENSISGPVCVSGSVGISFYPYDGNSYEELFRKADAAMYAAKKSGKDSFRVYTSEIDEIARS